MRNELITDKVGRPTGNKVLVRVTDIFNQIVRDSGIILPNSAHEEAWGDSKGYTISEFAIRHGVIESVPQILTSGSFGYDTEIEVQKGDIVYWSIIAFGENIPIVCGKEKYMLVDYHELIFRVRDEEITPINGNYLLAPVQEKKKFMEYESVVEVSNRWRITHCPERVTKELNPKYFWEAMWDVQDEVVLRVLDKPMKIEGDLIRDFDERIYAVPGRMILCAV